jgi:hypothetical protein
MKPTAEDVAVGKEANRLWDVGPFRIDVREEKAKSEAALNKS